MAIELKNNFDTPPQDVKEELINIIKGSGATLGYIDQVINPKSVRPNSRRVHSIIGNFTYYLSVVNIILSIIGCDYRFGYVKIEKEAKCSK